MSDRIAPALTRCLCVARHAPDPYNDLNLHHIQPRSWGGPDVPENRIWVCPTTHQIIHSLLNLYVRTKGDPGPAALRHYPRYARTLALEAIKRAGGVRPIYTAHYPREHDA